jgi:CDP-paratose 2-epimerase
VENITISAGKVFNVGGGPTNTMSIWTEFSPLLEELIGHPIHVRYADWRPGDQPVFVSDIRKAENELGWRPHVSVKQGINCLFGWIRDHKELFQHL